MEREVDILRELTAPLLTWYDGHSRDLPWRREVSPYRTWVSEIMLQQTRVAAVLPYFERFMAAFPTVEALSAADTAVLLKLWEGLGYYSRARHLKKAAQIITEEYGGQFPHTYRELTKLPGIGDYTAGAILSIAFDQPVPAVDGNVLRIVSRLTGSSLDVLDGKNRALVRGWMAQVVPTERPGAYNQALMDLGATVCLPSGAPLCEQCPAAAFCAARRQGLQASLPVRAKKAPRRTEELTVFVLLRADGAVALRRRKDTGLLAQLWEYPNVSGTLDEAQAASQLAAWGLTPHRWRKRLSARHVFTHILWEMTGYVVETDGAGAPDWLWADEAERRRCAVPSAFEKFTKELEGEDHPHGTALF